MRSFVGKLIFALALVMVGDGICHAYSLAEAQALERQKNWSALLRYARAWTQAQPNDFNAWGSLSVAYLFLGHPDLALEPTKRSIALNPREPGAWTALGWLYRDLKRYPESADAFKHAVDLAPQNGNFWNNLAAAYADQGDYVMTLKTLEQQQSAGPYQSDVLWYDLGNGYLNVARSMTTGKPSGRTIEAVEQKAINAFKQSLAKNPRNADAWNNLGVVQESAGATREALNNYQRAASMGNSMARKNYADLRNEIANGGTTSRQSNPLGTRLATSGNIWANSTRGR